MRAVSAEDGSVLKCGDRHSPDHSGSRRTDGHVGFDESSDDRVISIDGQVTDAPRVCAGRFGPGLNWRYADESDMDMAAVAPVRSAPDKDGGTH
ncbi:hypothetical protein GCM10022255_019220 [Dactylosporangium darangshiense]|uniref:Uncharacterized protein n=1 Tax=Dactylosporangium darangshiense TaxID=579108 RepID=A0ABP8D3E6_9ACTN